MSVSKVLAHRLAAPPAAGASSGVELRPSAPVTAPGGVGVDGRREDAECRGAASALGAASARWPALFFCFRFFFAPPAAVATALPAALATEACEASFAACSSKNKC